MINLYVSLSIFCFVASVTPGPNNIILLVASNKVGIIRGIPVLLGICFGFSLMLACSGVVMFFLNKNIYLHSILSIASLIFLIYLCYGIFTIDVNNKLTSTKSNRKDFNFIKASLFQLINPKAWIICSAAAATYVKQDISYTFIFIIALCMSLIGCSPWLILGSYLDQILDTNLKKSIFFKTMSIILFITVIYSYLL